MVSPSTLLRLFLLPLGGKQVKTDPISHERVKGKDSYIEAVGRCTQVSSCPYVPHSPWGGGGKRVGGQDHQAAGGLRVHRFSLSTLQDFSHRGEAPFPPNCPPPSHSDQEKEHLFVLST